MLSRREFLMLAKSYKPAHHDIGGFYLSEKLDGTRVFWDGGLSRGLPTEEVPFASIYDPKTGDLKRKIKPIATGLWSRYGNPIIAPDWFLNQLPAIPLDGEIWAGRGNFQLTRSICGGDTPGPDWDKAEFAVFGCPPLDVIYQDGCIRNANMRRDILFANFELWLRKNAPAVLQDFVYLKSNGQAIPFERELLLLQDMIPSSGPIYLHLHRKLPESLDAANKAVECALEQVLDRGGEGIMLRDPKSAWAPKRVGTLLKYKPFQDAEGVVVGFTSGRRTDKGSKYLGKIGALILDFQGKRLELSGLTDIEREFSTGVERNFATKNPGVDMPEDFQGRHFHVGDVVTFKYRELSDDGIPKEARYWRRRENL